MSFVRSFRILYRLTRRAPTSPCLQSSLQGTRGLRTTTWNRAHLIADNDDADINMTLTKTENNHAISVLRSRPEYAKTLYTPEDLESNPACHSVVQDFVKLSREPDLKPLDHDFYVPIVEQVVKHAHEFSDADLLKVLHSFQAFPYCVPKSENFFKLWKELDKVCVQRLKSGVWGVDQLFVVDDAWYPSDLVKRTDYHWYMIKKCFRKCEKLTKEQFVRFMFCLNRTRKIHESINTYELEHNLIRLIDQFSAEELAIVCLAFFKTGTPIRDPVTMSKVLNVVSDSADSVDSIQLAAVAKATRLSTNFNIADAVYDFMRAFSPHIDRLSVTACLHLILSGSQHINVIDFDMLPKVLAKFDENIKTLRLKEIERLCLVMSMFNVHHDSLWSKILDELRDPERQKEIHEYGRCLPAIAHYLSFREIFPADLIDRILSPSFQKAYYGQGLIKYRRELLCLDLTAGLEVPDYTGHRLKESMRKYLLKTFTYWIAKENQGKVTMFQSNLRTVADVIERAFNAPKKALITAILPQYHTVELLFCTDKVGNAVDIPPYVSEVEQWVPKVLPKAAHYAPIIFHVFILMARNNMIFKTNDVTGQTHLRERQMRKMGYNTHKINSIQWLELNDDSRAQVVKDLVARGVAEVRRRDEEQVSNG